MGGSSFSLIRASFINVLCLWLLFLQPSTPYPVGKALVDASRASNDCHQMKVDVRHVPKPVMEPLARAIRLKSDSAFLVSASGASNDIFEAIEVAAEGRSIATCPAIATCQGDKGLSLMSPVSPIHAVLLWKPQELNEKHLFFIVNPSVLELGLRCNNLSLSYACGGQEGRTVTGQCWSVKIRALPSHKNSHHVHTRSAATIPKQPKLSPSSRHASQHSFRTILVASVLLVIGVIALIAVIPLCAHGSQTYETQSSPSKRRSSSEIAQQPAGGESVTLKVESQSDLLTNGSLAKDSWQQNSGTATRENGESSGSRKGGSSPVKKTRSISSESESGGQRSPRGRSHSGWEQVPLPEVPKLEPAEAQPPKNEGEPEPPTGNDEDEAGYAYARVAKEDTMEGSESEDEGKKAEGVSKTERNIPPYGKVTRHPNSKSGSPEAEPEGESYTEVREFPRHSPAILQGRLRSRTEPVEPPDVVATREQRAFTQSATHLPLPSIPGVRESNRMYDIIPDGIKATTATRVVPIKSRPPPLKTPRERLYESVDDMEKPEPESMYESVPDEIRHLEPPVSPQTPPPIAVPSPSIQRSIVQVAVPQPPPPPASPIPRKDVKEGDDGPKKKKLAKTTSEGDSRKRAFSKSLFGRKKAQSVSVVKAKKEKDQHEPLPGIPIPPADAHTSPTHVSPPTQFPPPTHFSPTHLCPPSIPPPFPPQDEDDEEDSTYDRPQLDYPRPVSESDGSPGKRISIEDSKMKSQSLPMSMRSAGHTVFHPRPHLPLPDLPEDSGSGAVAVGVVHRAKQLEPQDPDYDTVVRDEDGEQEVPYETVNREEVFAALEREQGAAEPRVKKSTEEDEPPYDSVKKASMAEDEPPYDSVKKASTVEDEPPYDSVKGKEQDAGYGRVTKSATPNPEGEDPEHDELGYAVIPAEVIKQKHAARGITPEDLDADDDEMGYGAAHELETNPGLTSDDTALQSKDPGYESVKNLQAEVGQTAGATAAFVEEPYAQVDMIAKRLSQRKRKEQQRKGQNPLETEDVQSPPPVPPAQDLGVDLTEFEEPPIPAQSEDMHIMVEKEDPPYSRVIKIPKDGAANDPPYAKVIKGQPQSSDVVLPYASFNILEGADDGTATGHDVANEKATSTTEEQLRDSALGYDSVDVMSPKHSGTDPHTLRDKVLGYDTVGDQLATENGPSTSDVTVRIPTLRPAEPRQHMYDSLEGVLDPEDEEATATAATYDCLLPKSVEIETEIKSDDDDRYEEIDENVRMNLIQMHLRKHTS